MLDSIRERVAEYLGGAPRTAPTCSSFVTSAIESLAIEPQLKHAAGVIHRDLKPDNILHSPSILFIDEMDGLLPRGDNGYYMGQHQIQFVEQALMLMSQLDPNNQVFLIGTTNHIDNIDPRVLRGGRFTEKIEIGATAVWVPSAWEYFPAKLEAC
jgi:hypothetical protein